MSKLTGYSSYPGYGWRKYGRLTVNFAKWVGAYEVWFDGELIFSRPSQP